MGLFGLGKRSMVKICKIKHEMENVGEEKLSSLSHYTRTWGHPEKMNVR